MDMYAFCSELPKIELHAHLNGSLSKSTMLQLKRHYADSSLDDKSNIFFDEFQIGAGDTRNLSNCFQVFGIAHALTSTPETLEIATKMTLQEFDDDGCCYIELRSTPRDTPHMTKKQYIDTIAQSMQKVSVHLPIMSRLIVSINRSHPISEAEIITDLAIEYHKKYPDVVVGLELSGEPTVGKFEDFVPCFTRAKESGLKITLHCGEVCNPEEIICMLNFKPDRIGHGTCIHPNHGGTENTWASLFKTKTPVEVCLTSNVNTKSAPDYASHHFKELYNAELPVILCTDDKGVFATSLSQEYRICAETFDLDQTQLARLALNACQFIFAQDLKKPLMSKILNFMDKYSL
ncbi:unnamed protein product [Chilo suppressalis]|uniref:Adenosine deaminase domain-containing protein n=1 Tax=Chilo suppressalis TaxID=168631 RepID=A0ABN8AVU5_CHISP|nr:hypothetical protein evm_014024 [Chilo suppressalis]CAH0397343.1 unnamed protein product [Chilo suppressalis]